MIRALALSLLVACGGDEDLAEAHYIELIEDGECDEEPEEEGDAVYWFPQLPVDAICQASCCDLGADKIEYCTVIDIVWADDEPRIYCDPDCMDIAVHCIYVD